MKHDDDDTSPDYAEAALNPLPMHNLNALSVALNEKWKIADAALLHQAMQPSPWLAIIEAAKKERPP